jgi:tetratricopeptide (TPR) repeat protein
MENRACVFLPPDAVYPDGTFAKLEAIIDSGKKAVFVPPLRVAEETFVPVFLEQFYSEDELTATISPRELAKLALNNLHPEYKTSFWDSIPFNHWPSQLLWRVDNEGVLLRSFHPQILMSKPPYREVIPESLWDKATQLDGCDYPLFAHPDFKEIYVVEDSDEIFTAGTTPVKKLYSPILPKRLSILEIANWAAYWANSHHRRCVTYKLRIHSSDLSPSLWREVEKTSDRIINQILFLSKNRKILKIANWIGVLLSEKMKLNFLFQSALLHLQKGRLKKAEKKLKKILSMKPSDKDIIVLTHYNLGSLYEKKGDLEIAREKFNEAINLAKGVPSFEGGAHFHLGCIHKRMGEIEKAKHHFEECLRFIPNHKEGWKALRSIYLQEGRADKLEEKFKEILSLHKDKADVRCGILIQMGTFYSEQKRYKEAEKTLDKAFSLNLPTNTLTSIHYALASLYEKRGDLEEAKEKFNEVINLAKGIPSFEGGAHFHLGCIYKKMGEIKEARSHFEECLKFIPDHRKAKENLKSLKKGI